MATSASSIYKRGSAKNVANTFTEDTYLSFPLFIVDNELSFTKTSSGEKESIGINDIQLLNDLTIGQGYPEKAIILDNSKNIEGINNQINTGIFTHSFNNDINNTGNLLFQRSRGGYGIETPIFHNDIISSIQFSAFMNNSEYYNTSSIISRVVGSSYIEDNISYINSEIVFSTTGIGNREGSHLNERVKIDTYGNLNILYQKEIKLYSNSSSNFSGFRASTRTSNTEGYIMELPPDKGLA